MKNGWKTFNYWNDFTARVIRLIDSLLYGENEIILKIHREFADNFPKNHFLRILFKIILPKILMILIFSEKYSLTNFA